MPRADGPSVAYRVPRHRWPEAWLRLHTRGATVKAHDPIATPHTHAQHPDLPATLHDVIDDLAKGCDALVITTDWNDYRHLDWPHLATLMRGNLVLDARNLISPDAVRAAGLTYVGIGR